MTGFSLRSWLGENLVGVTLEIDASGKSNPDGYIDNLVRLVRGVGYDDVSVRRGEGTEQGIYHVRVLRQRGLVQNA